MAVQSNSGPGLPFCGGGFVTITILRGWTVSPAPNPQLEDQLSVSMTPGDSVAHLYPQALSGLTVGLFFDPGHHTRHIICYQVYIKPKVRMSLRKPNVSLSLVHHHCYDNATFGLD
jgi:hypothetical protein